MRAIAAIAERAGRADLQEVYADKANKLGRLVKERLWDETAEFFRCVPLPDRRAERRHYEYGIFYSGSELKRWLQSRGDPAETQIGEKGHQCLWNGPS